MAGPNSGLTIPDVGRLRKLIRHRSTANIPAYSEILTSLLKSSLYGNQKHAKRSVRMISAFILRVEFLLERVNVMRKKPPHLAMYLEDCPACTG
jgi:hypothetical protein